MKIVILNTAGVPIYEQIKEQVKAAIYAGELSEGEALPSIRQLARDLKISVITTTRAYSDLEEEGLVTNVQGKGCFVRPQNPEMVREQALREVEAGLEAAAAAAKRAGIGKDELFTMFRLMTEETDNE